MIACPQCAAPQPDDALACAACGALLWRDRLSELHEQSRRAEASGDLESCLETLSECLRLLPPGCRQFEQIERETQRLVHLHNAQPPSPPAAMLAEPVAAADLRAGTVGGAVRGSLRCMAAGLAKRRTYISLALSTLALGYFIGWWQALVLGLFIYVHEMGHVLLIQYYGYRFGWPVFIPLLGAFVLQDKPSQRPHESVAIALAGPLAGSLASLVLYAVHAVHPLPAPLMEVAYINLIINFFNLIPLSILDGARVAAHLGRRVLLAVVAGLYLFAGIGMNAYALILALGWTAGAPIHWAAARRADRTGAETPKPRRLLAATALALMVVSAWTLQRFRP